MNAHLLIAVFVLAIAGRAAAQSTAFTYQGRLKSGGQPAAGLHDTRSSTAGPPRGA